ncbi:MAG: nitrilase-related carbon-nitrogen hydrolase [Pseudomonadota bacterium]|nr:nitrilase-related carbon-nitrogen hydrolase [Pseudomonadota bacterium]
MNHLNSRLTVSLIQMNVSLGQPKRNLNRVKKLIDRDLNTPTDLILLPEMWSTGYDFPKFSRLAGSTPTLLEQLKTIAIQRSTTIGGTMLEQEGENFYNTFYLIDPAGEIISRYRKIHLFSLMNEPDFLSPGREMVISRIRDIPVGLMTCYDLRFPEFSHQLALKGAGLLLISAQWPQQRAAHWQALLKARAIENQLFIVACNRIGQGTEQVFPGLSAVYNPWGEQILKPPRRQGGFNCQLDFKQLQTARRTIDIFSDRRPDVYRAE